MSIAKDCKVSDCMSAVLARDLCNRHYKRMLRGKSLTAQTIHDPRPAVIKNGLAYIPLGLYAKHGYSVVDIKDAHRLDRYRWAIDSSGYAITRINGKMWKLHHLVAGKPPKGFVTDHINRNRVDNRRQNLRFATYSENVLNTSVQPKNASGHRNIILDRNSYRVVITRKRIRCYDKNFRTLDTAIAARDKFLSTL